MSLSIHIPQFEGPLGLLLYLIRKEEMDIFDIDVHLITSQYLEYIKKMKQFDLEVAGDFIAMAATLIQIKSKMLLPNYNEEGEVDEVEDPRKELVQRLIEYQKFQEVSKKLYDRPLLGRDVFRRGKSSNIHSDEDGEIILDDGGLFSLIAHYRNSVRKMKKAIHRVARKTRSIASRILEIKDRFVVGQRLVLRDLIQNVEDVKQELLITFLSCLEMGKMGLVSVYQSEVYGDIYLTAKREITSDAIERVEEYDSHGSEELADSLMDQAEEEALFAGEATEEQMSLGDAPSEDSPESMATDDDILQAEQELSIEEGMDFESEFVGEEKKATDENFVDQKTELGEENLLVDTPIVEETQEEPEVISLSEVKVESQPPMFAGSEINGASSIDSQTEELASYPIEESGVPEIKDETNEEKVSMDVNHSDQGSEDEGIPS